MVVDGGVDVAIVRPSAIGALDAAEYLTELVEELNEEAGSTVWSVESDEEGFFLSDAPLQQFHNERAAGVALWAA